MTRFGWKAQNKSLLVFAGEAYNVEMGVSNEVFTNERSAVSGCVFNPTPEDAIHVVNPNNFGSLIGTASAMSSDVVIAVFMRLLAPQTPTTASQSEQNGQALFASTGCPLCHTQSLTTAASIYTGMSSVTYHPYSDFAIHHMGSGLADGITRDQRGRISFAQRPYGAWGKDCSSCMTDAHRIC